jgi:hypothetical protein
MTDTTEPISATSAGDVRARNKDTLFTALARSRGICRVTVDHNGCSIPGRSRASSPGTPVTRRSRFRAGPKFLLLPENPDQPLADNGLDSNVGLWFPAKSQGRRPSRRSLLTISSTRIRAEKPMTAPSEPSSSRPRPDDPDPTPGALHRRRRIRTPLKNRPAPPGQS